MLQQINILLLIMIRSRRTLSVIGLSAIVQAEKPNSSHLSLKFHILARVSSLYSSSVICVDMYVPLVDCLRV